jgi:hypothetical protein
MMFRSNFPGARSPALRSNSPPCPTLVRDQVTCFKEK